MRPTLIHWKSQQCCKPDLGSQPPPSGKCINHEAVAQSSVGIANHIIDSILWCYSDKCRLKAFFNDAIMLSRASSYCDQHSNPLLHRQLELNWL